MQALERKNGIRKGFMLLFFVAALFWVGFCWGTGDAETSTETAMRGFALILWSILLEALPFVLLGTILSSLIQVYVSEETILRILPRNNYLRLVMASLIGLVFPVCECAIIPITRGLIKKGLPVGPAVAFMIATPIVNPIVLLSTYNAFPTMPEMVAFRAGCGFAGAILIGLLAGRMQGKAVLRPDADAGRACGCGQPEHAHASCTCGHEKHTAQDPAEECGPLRRVIVHTGEELRSVGAYLIFGAIIAACVQMAVPKDALAGVGAGRVTSILVMMLLAFLLSLCSEADAFVASTFLLHFSGASVLAFLITGPMIDIKNTMMLMGSFRKWFVLRVMLAILLTCFLLALAAGFLMGSFYA